MWAASCLASCCAACACDACRTVVSGISRRSARIAYCGLFALSLFVAWILREVAAPLMESIPWINHFKQTPSREWFETDAVLRVGFGNFLFFTVLATMMVGVKTQKDPRDGLHHGGWMMKIVCWCLMVIFTFFFRMSSSAFMKQYQSLAPVCFFSFKLCSCWILFMDGMTNGLDLMNNSVALHPAVNGSILPASVISLYCTYLCYSALASEPRDYACNGLHKHSKAVSTGSLPLGLVTTVLSVVYSAVHAAVRVAISETWRRKAIWNRMKDFHLLTGIPVTSHIISLKVGSEDKALQASRHLLQAGFHANAIRPPTVPPNSCRLRVALSAVHTREDLENLAAALSSCINFQDTRIYDCNGYARPTKTTVANGKCYHATVNIHQVAFHAQVKQLGWTWSKQLV